MDGASGININGVMFFDSSSAENHDPYYPAQWSESTSNDPDTVDACIGHPDGDGLYHYHIMSPCLFNTNANYTTSVCD